MDTSHDRPRLGAAWLYRRLMRLHNAVPYHLMPSGRAFPTWHYFFEVTRRCNLRCEMCQYKDWFERHPAKAQLEGELTTEEWKDLIDQTGRLGLITFTGGEPWMRKDFIEILEYASARRRTHLITNGILFDEERIRRCADAAPKRLTGKGLCFLGMSIDGTREIHDAIRGRKGAFDKTIEHIRALAQRRSELGKRCPMLHVTAVIQDGNLDALPQMPAILAEAGADVFNLTIEVAFPGLEGVGETDPATYSPAALELPRIPPERLEKALDLTREAARKAGIELRLPDMPQRDLIRYYDGGLDLTHFMCRGAWTNLYIGAQGDVFPCFIQKVGNVREQRFSEIWSGTRMREFRKRVKKGLFPICQGCCHLEHAGK